jgi:hypothetical protein
MTTPQQRVPVDRLPKIDSLLRDPGFQLRLEEQLRQSSALRLLPEPNLLAMTSLAILSFHPDGRIPARERAGRMNGLSNRLRRELSAMTRSEAWAAMDPDVVKEAVQQQRDLKRQQIAAVELSHVKHLGVCWQGAYLVVLSRAITKSTGWDNARVLKTVVELVAAVLHAANVQIWFDEVRLRDLLRSAIYDFEADDRHNYLLQRLG